MKENELEKPLTDNAEEMKDLSNQINNVKNNDLDIPLAVKETKLSPYYRSNFLGKFFFTYRKI